LGWVPVPQDFGPVGPPRIPIDPGRPSRRRPQRFCQPADRELDGTILAERQAFERIKGYDEVFRGWGGEDFDIRSRLTVSGVGQSPLPPLLTPIRHDNAERVVFHAIKDTQLQFIVNCFYLAAKRQLTAIAGPRQEVSEEALRRVMETIVREMTAWSRDRRTRPSVTFDVSGTGWLPPPFVLLSKSSFTLTLSDQPPRESRHRP